MKYEHRIFEHSQLDEVDMFANTIKTAIEQYEALFDKASEKGWEYLDTFRASAAQQERQFFVFKRPVQ